MPDLLLLDDVEQLEDIRARNNDLFNQTRVVTSDPVVAACLEDLGVPFIDLWTLIDGEDLARNRARTHEIIAHWWGSDAVCVNYRGRSLVHAASQELRDAMETCLNAHTVYERLLDTAAPQVLHGYFFRPTPMRRSGPAPLNRASLALAHTVLRDCAARRDLPVRPLRNPTRLSSEQRDGGPTGVISPPAHPDSWRAWLTPEVPGHIAWDGPRPNLAALRSAGSLALLVENVQNPRELKHLEQAFRSRPGWAFIRLIASDQSPCRSWPWHLRSLFRRVKRARAAFEAWCDGYTGPHPEIFGSAAMRRQFRSIWADLLRAVGLGESFAHALDLLEPDVTLFGYSSFTLERVMVWAARERGIPVVGLTHGGLQTTSDAAVRAGDESDLFIWGDEEARSLSPDPSGRNLHVVGSLRYWQEYQAWDPDLFENPSRERECRETRVRLGFPPDRPVVLLITTAINSGLCLVGADGHRHRACWRELLALIRRRSDLSFVLKPHPSFDSFGFYRYLLRDAPANLHLAWDEYLTRILPAATVAVLINCVTTGALEAILAGLPVVYLRQAAYASSLHQDSLREHGAVKVNTVDQFEIALDRLLEDPGLRHQARLEAGKLLRAVLDDPQIPAPRRVVERLEAIASAALSERRSPSERLDFATQYGELAHLLETGSWNEISAAWQRFVEELRHRAVPPRCVRPYLFHLSVDLGRGTADPAELLRRLRHCLRLARPLRLSPADRRGAVVNACLTSLQWHGYPTDSPEAAILASTLLRLQPQSLLGLPSGAELLRRLGTPPPPVEVTAGEPELRARVCHLEAEVGALRRSWTWKMGRLFVSPFAGVRRLLKGRHTA